jgi:hypothetical protein
MTENLIYRNSLIWDNQMANGIEIEIEIISPNL